MAGDFVVATAGPDLESVLSAKGAGADAFSEEHRQAVANIDIGGGTSNIALFQKGNLKGTSCLDIGGRLIKIENGRISYIFPKIQKLAEAHGIHIAVGDRAEEPFSIRSVNIWQISWPWQFMPEKQTAFTQGFIQMTENH